MEAKVKTNPRLYTLDDIPELRVPPGELGAVLELIVRNKKGEVTQYQIMESRSFVRQFLQALWMNFTHIYSGYRTNPKRLRDTGNNIQYLISAAGDWACNAGTGSTTYGILVGTGITAPTIDDYKIETLIGHGTGAGQLQYSAVTFGAPASDGTTSQFTITRDFANGSGSAVTVREIGLVVNLPNWSGGSGYFLTIRDAVNITVPNGETLTVNYRIQATA